MDSSFCLENNTLGGKHGTMESFSFSSVWASVSQPRKNFKSQRKSRQAAPIPIGFPEVRGELALAAAQEAVGGAH